MKIFLLLIIIGLNCDLTSAAGEDIRYGTWRYWEWWSSTKNIRTAAFSPLDLGPTGAYATHRFASNSNEFILRLRGDVAGELDIWDIQEGTSNYKTSSTDSWTDGSGDTWHVVRWYDQLDDSRSLYVASAGNQPLFTFDVKSGQGSIGRRDDNSLAMLNNSSNPNMDIYIDADLGYIFDNVRFDQAGATATGSSCFSLSETMKDGYWYLAITRGIRSGTDGIYIYNWDGIETFTYATPYVLQTWYTVCWEHTDDNLYAWRDKTRYGPGTSGDTAQMGGYPELWCLNVENTGYHWIDHTMLLFYDHLLTVKNIEDIIDYCNAH